MEYKNWKYQTQQVVYLIGSKSTGLPMYSVIARNSDVPWGKVTGTITDLLGTSASPEYSVIITPRWQHFFSYRGITLGEKDIYIPSYEGEKVNPQYLDEGLFEL